MAHYFKNLYFSSSCESVVILDKVERKVTNFQNNLLLQLFDVYEVKEALFFMHLDYSPCPNGLNLGFN